MANIFAILTALVLAVSGFLAYANMGDEGTPGKGYKGWIAKRQDMEGKLARNQALLAKTTKERDDNNAELADYNGRNETESFLC